MLNGTGNALLASTCDPGTDYATLLTVFAGSCENLACVETTDMGCNGFGKMVMWPSIARDLHIILVRGNSSNDELDTGSFVLTVLKI
jgi:hypothetical protein